MGYNDTGMPNLAENKLQADAKYEVSNVQKELRFLHISPV
jgi:hypothetical protein